MITYDLTVHLHEEHTLKRTLYFDRKKPGALRNDLRHRHSFERGVRCANVCQNGHPIGRVYCAGQTEGRAEWESLNSLRRVVAIEQWLCAQRYRRSRMFGEARHLLARSKEILTPTFLP